MNRNQFNSVSVTSNHISKQVFFAHSGGPQGGPLRGSYDFVKWLRGNLGKEYLISDPKIEEPDDPTYEMWKTMFDREFPEITENVLLIGHSLGGSMLLKYLSEAPSPLKIAGLFLVAAPFWGDGGWAVDEFALRNDFAKHLPVIPVIHLYHCLDDPVVPFNHLELYQNVLPHAFAHELSGSEHAFSDGLPLIVEHIKSLHINQQTKREYEDDANTGK